MKISIAMASYNGERFLREQLQSIAQQTLKPCELVITDDGSTDRTPEIFAEFAQSAGFPVRFIRNEKRLGFVGNFMKAASLCTGDLIAFCDQDDVWLSHKLARCAECFRDDSVMLAIHSAEMVNENLKPLGVQFPKAYRDAVVPSLTPAPGHGFSGFAMVFRPSLPLAFDERHPWTAEVLPCPIIFDHDQWIYFLSNIFGKTALIQESLALYRRHGSTVTSPKAHSMGDITARSLSVGNESYIKNADLAAHRASYLEQSCAGLSGKHRMSALRAIEHYRKTAESYLVRARIYQKDASLKARLASTMQLLARGEYGAHSRIGSGPRSFAKDLCIGVLKLRRPVQG
jgi:glycosyltransferase involved in cell wall biosynthesis